MSLQANLTLLTGLPGLNAIEAVIASKFASDAPKITEISRYLLDLGGKRIRPVLTVLCGQLFGIEAPFEKSSRGQQLIDVAAGIELIHMATLLHDDIIDKSPVRRHKPSPYKLFGTDSTLLAGDFLLTRAFGLCARLDRFVIDRTETACVALTEGEILETSLVQEPHSVNSSLLVARKKTAALFSLAAETATHISGAPERSVSLMAEFGTELGIAFQILDDVLDITSNEETLGKRSGQDLRERKPSLVNVLWLESKDPRAQHLRRAPCADDEVWVAEALSTLPKSDVIARARKMAEQYVAKASECLSGAIAAFEAPVHRTSHELLDMLMRYVLERVR